MDFYLVGKVGKSHRYRDANSWKREFANSYNNIPRNARSYIFVEVKSGGPWIIIPHGSMGTGSDMQLTSEPTEKRPVGAVAAFETLGAVNRSASLVRTKTTTVVWDGTRSNWARCNVSLRDPRQGM